VGEVLVRPHVLAQKANRKHLLSLVRKLFTCFNRYGTVGGMRMHVVCVQRLSTNFQPYRSNILVNMYPARWLCLGAPTARRRNTPELNLNSYCLWEKENLAVTRRELHDIPRRLLFSVLMYYPSIWKVPFSIPNAATKMRVKKAATHLSVFWRPWVQLSLSYGMRENLITFLNRK
jgi:hypothetical protein